MDKKLVIVSDTQGNEPVSMYVTHEQLRLLDWLSCSGYLIVDAQREDVVDMTEEEE